MSHDISSSHLESLHRRLAILEEENQKLKCKLSKSGDELHTYRGLFHNTPNSVVVLDKKGTLIEANSRFYNWFGFSAEEIMGNNFLALTQLDVDTKSVFLKHFTQRMMGFEVPPYQVELQNKNGDTACFRISAGVIKDNNDSISKIVIILQDITTLVEKELSTVADRNKFKKLTEMAASAIFIIQNSKIKYINPSGEEISGYAQKDIVGKRLFDIVHPDFRNKVHGLGSKLLNGHELVQNEVIKIVASNGDTKWLNFSFTLTDYENRPAILGTAFDISGEKTLEEERARYMDELKLLNSSKDKFFSIIAHDLKGPFSALLGYSDFLANDIKELTTEEIAEYGRNINDVTKSLHDLLDNLLQWSRLQTGRINVREVKLDFVHIISDIIELYNESAKSKRIDLHYENYAEGDFITADTNILYTVLRNLTSNAIKFTKPEGRVIISTEQYENGVMFFVKDTGIGIAEENIPKLFNIEKQYTTQGTNSETGTGLGLVLCKELIEISGGYINVSSELNKGSEFSFFIPDSK